MNQANHTASFGTLFSALAALTAPGQGFLTSRPSEQTIGRRQARDGLGRRLQAALQAFERRREAARTRQALHHLDDRLLRDIGLSRADLGVELEPPFIGLGDPLARAGGGQRHGGPGDGRARRGLWNL